MLYECWQQIADQFRHDLALRDVATGQAWTFAELRAEAERSARPAGGVVFPRGKGASFVIEMLRAWRWQKSVCPLEEDQTPPPLPSLPAGCVQLKLTSSTTGQPRWVAFTAEQLAADAENIVATMGLRPDWPNVGAISLAHSYGFSNLITPLLLHGIPLILSGSTLPEPLRQAIRTTDVLTLPGVPALWRAWHEARVLPAKVRLAISAGAPLPLPLEQAVFAETGIKLHNFYGSSECGGIAYDASTAPRSDPSCVGAPMQNVAVARNDHGCLEVRSRAVGQSYWPEADPALGEGCFRTSDLGELKAGLVYLRGRLSEQINVAGRKISPEVIEGALRGHPKVRECLVFGAPAPDAERAEIIVAAVAGAAGLLPSGLRQFLLERLPAWQVPRDWVLVDELPANARGKLSRSEWREKYQARGERSCTLPGSRVPPLW